VLNDKDEILQGKTDACLEYAAKNNVPVIIIGRWTAPDSTQESNRWIRITEKENS